MIERVTGDMVPPVADQHLLVELPGQLLGTD
jgi:hypothetical protein